MGIPWYKNFEGQNVDVQYDSTNRRILYKFKSQDDTAFREFLGLEVPASAVNYPRLVSSATGNAIELEAVGDDTNIDILLKPKGSGQVVFESGSAGIKVLADTGGISAGDVVAVTGYDATTGLAKADQADANAAATAYRDLYYAPAAISAGATGYVYKRYVVVDSGLNASGGAIGDPVYLSETAGEMTLTAPTGADAVQVEVGTVITATSDAEVHVDLTGADAQFDIHNLTALSAAPATDDLIPISDESASGDPNVAITVTELLTAAGDLTDLAAAPESGDRLLVTDESESGDPAKSVSVANLADAVETAATLASYPGNKAFGYVYMSAQATDADTVTINGRTYEFDPSDDGITGDVEVDTSGSSDVDGDITALAAAINGDGSAEVDATADTNSDVVWLYAKTLGTAGNSITLAESTSEARMKVSSATLVDGDDASKVAVLSYAHTITTNEATLGVLRINTGLTSIDSFNTEILDGGDGGTLKAPDVTVTISGGVVVLGEGSAPAWANGDIMYLTVVGRE